MKDLLFIPLLRAILLFGIIGFSANAAGLTVFSYSSSPDSFELQGQNGIVAETDGTFGANKSFGSRNAITAFIFASPPWLMTFAAPNGALLQVGNYYGAVDVPNATAPWITFGAFSRRCSQTGYFSVLEVNYGSGDTINSLAIDFVAYDFGLAANWNEGKFRYNSAIPIPEPSSGLWCMAFILALGSKPFVRFVRQTRAPSDTASK